MAKKIVSQSPVPETVGRNIEAKLAFPDAIFLVMGGKKIRREEWADKEEYGLMKDNFLMIYRGGKFHTWIVSEGDMLAQDWVIV